MEKVWEPWTCLPLFNSFFRHDPSKICNRTLWFVKCGRYICDRPVLADTVANRYIDQALKCIFISILILHMGLHEIDLDKEMCRLLYCSQYEWIMIIVMNCWMLSDKQLRQIAYLNYNLLISVETVSSLVSNLFFQHSRKWWLQGLKSPINQIKKYSNWFYDCVTTIGDSWSIYWPIT